MDLSPASVGSPSDPLLQVEALPGTNITPSTTSPRSPAKKELKLLNRAYSATELQEIKASRNKASAEQQVLLQDNESTAGSSNMKADECLGEAGGSKPRHFLMLGSDSVPNGRPVVAASSLDLLEDEFSLLRIDHEQGASSSCSTRRIDEVDVPSPSVENEAEASLFPRKNALVKERPSQFPRVLPLVLPSVLGENFEKWRPYALASACVEGSEAVTYGGLGVRRFVTRVFVDVFLRTAGDGEIDWLFPQGAAERLSNSVRFRSQAALDQMHAAMTDGELDEATRFRDAIALELRDGLRKWMRKRYEDQSAKMKRPVAASLSSDWVSSVVAAGSTEDNHGQAPDSEDASETSRIPLLDEYLPKLLHDIKAYERHNLKAKCRKYQTTEAGDAGDLTAAAPSFFERLLFEELPSNVQVFPIPHTRADVDAAKADQNDQWDFEGTTTSDQNDGRSAGVAAWRRLAPTKKTRDRLRLMTDIIADSRYSWRFAKVRVAKGSRVFLEEESSAPGEKAENMNISWGRASHYYRPRPEAWAADAPAPERSIRIAVEYLRIQNQKSGSSQSSIYALTFNFVLEVPRTSALQEGDRGTSLLRLRRLYLHLVKGLGDDPSAEGEETGLAFAFQ
eukprot:g15784.t1